MNTLERILCITGGLMIIQSGLLTDIAGAVLTAVVLGNNYRLSHRQRVNPG